MYFVPSRKTDFLSSPELKAQVNFNHIHLLKKKTSILGEKVKGIQGSSNKGPRLFPKMARR